MPFGTHMESDAKVAARRKVGSMATFNIMINQFIKPQFVTMSQCWPLYKLVCWRVKTWDSKPQFVPSLWLTVCTTNPFVAMSEIRNLSVCVSSSSKKKDAATKHQKNLSQSLPAAASKHTLHLPLPASKLICTYTPLPPKSLLVSRKRWSQIAALEATFYFWQIGKSVRECFFVFEKWQVGVRDSGTHYTWCESRLTIS